MMNCAAKYGRVPSSLTEHVVVEARFGPEDHLTAGAAVTGCSDISLGNDDVERTRGTFSLSLPAASSAKSPQTFVDAAYPSIRFFIAGTGSLAVNVVSGRWVTPAGLAVAGGIGRQVR
jgi:hypothetical protein